MQSMGKVDCIAFDKTGTLTYGNLKVSNIIPLDVTISNIELLSKAASVEKRSEHPLGKAIVQYAEDNGFVISEVKDFRMIPGKGVTAELSGKTVICGNALYNKRKNRLPRPIKCRIS